MNPYICKKCGGSMWEEQRVNDIVDVKIAVVCQDCGHEFIKSKPN